MIIPLMGAYHRPPALAILKVLPAGFPLSLEPEPGNEYDPNAVKVVANLSHLPETAHEELVLHCAGQGFGDLAELLAAPWHIGYLARDKVLAHHCPAEAQLCFLPTGKPGVLWEG